MSDSASRNDPRTSFNFVIDIQGMRAGFSEVVGLSATSVKVPGQAQHNSLNFKRGYTVSRELWEWRKKVIDGKTQRLPGTITLLDETRKPVRVWRFRQGWPSKWAGPAFNANSNEIAIEELEICVEGLELAAIA